MKEYTINTISFINLLYILPEKTIKNKKKKIVKLLNA